MGSMKKSVALIIVVFAMMVFAILGWTLANLISGDFEANLRNLESERALYLSEAGAQWALSRLSTNPDESRPWTVTHTLDYGQYQVTAEDGTETDQVIITSTGYIPTLSDYRTMRQVRLIVVLGSLEKAVRTQVPQDASDPDKGLFNWWPANQAYSVKIEGDISVGHYVEEGQTRAGGYEGDGDGVNDPTMRDELGEDYDPPPPPLLPQDISKKTKNDERGFAGSFPSIDMQWFYDNADNYWSPPRTAEITAISSQQDVITVDSGIFTTPTSQWKDQALRNISRGSWESGNWEVIDQALGSDRVRLANAVDWQVGDRVIVVPKISSISKIEGEDYIYEVELDCNYPLEKDEVVRNLNIIDGYEAWAYETWAVVKNPIITTSNSTTFRIEVDSSVSNLLDYWEEDDWIVEAKRFSSKVSGLWYIMADTLIDLRGTNTFKVKDTYIISEGDIGIKGGNEIRMRFSPNAPRYPNLATKYGDITSKDIPQGNTPDERMRLRRFDGLIYSEFGHVDFNYLRGTLVYGDRITFDGQIRIDYRSGRLSTSGFVFNPSIVTWWEQ
jgi:hypothetical protein